MLFNLTYLGRWGWVENAFACEAGLDVRDSVYAASRGDCELLYKNFDECCVRPRLAE